MASFRLMTYNVHSCIGTDAHLSYLRIASVIAEHAPDIVALQELDVGKARSGRMDQAHTLARLLKMDFHFHPAIQLAEEKYGDALFSRFPLRLVRAAALPTVLAGRILPQRGALWASVRVHDHEVQVINAHFGINERERALQARTLLGAEWANHPRCRGPVVLCGDFNSVPASVAYQRLRRRLRDVQRCVPGMKRRTYPSVYPMLRLDHIFVSPDIAVDHVMVPRSRLIRLASDHLPLVADLRLT
ncbi:endonuclease/exonuclease/phosphatase family protein [bacterium]|nr:endonuclease/exonuclease/phosphatase family protein [bacterium]